MNLYPCEPKPVGPVGIIGTITLASLLIFVVLTPIMNRPLGQHSIKEVAQWCTSDELCHILEDNKVTLAEYNFASKRYKKRTEAAFLDSLKETCQ